jgi:hypothetical protein
VTRIRYPFVRETSDGRSVRQDPLPHIRRHMKDIYSSYALPSWQSLVRDVLFDYRDLSPNNGGSLNLRQNTMFLLGHEAHIPSILKSLSMFGHDLDIEADLEIPDVDDKASMRVGQGLLLVVPDPRKDETHSAMVERVVVDFRGASEAGKNLCVVHSSLDVLKQCKSFLEEDA